MKYIGDLAGLNGTTKEDQLAVDMWCEYIAEVWIIYIIFFLFILWCYSSFSCV